MVSEKLIKKFQEAVKKDHGEDLTFAQASEILNDLTDYFGTLDKIYRRMKADEDIEGEKQIEK